MKKKAIITSISGKFLKNKEKKLLKREKPWGLILFKRNISSMKQLIKLTKSIRVLFKDKKFPIMIDEEGGRICRLSFLEIFII